MSFTVPIRPSILFVGDPDPGASDPVFSRAGNLGGGPLPHSAAASFLSPFLHAGSRPTFHEWCAAITDPSRRARHVPADCHCGVAALLDPFHRSGVPHG